MNNKRGKGRFFRGEKDNFRGRSERKREGDIASSSRPFPASRVTRKVLQKKELTLLSNELLGMNQRLVLCAEGSLPQALLAPFPISLRAAAPGRGAQALPLLLGNSNTSRGFINVSFSFIFIFFVACKMVLKQALNRKTNHENSAWDSGPGWIFYFPFSPPFPSPNTV